MQKDNFPTNIAIFPLSNAVFFPKTILPLNIFEDRYIQLVDDCMKEGKMFGMVQPKVSINDKIEVYNVGCLGKIISFNETKDNYEASSSYSYTFGKENYISPFTFTKDWFLIGSILGEARYYYTPDKFSANINFSENHTWKIQRVNLKTETTDDDTTKSYSFNMARKFTLNHKFTKSFSSNYSKQIDFLAVEVMVF